MKKNLGDPPEHTRSTLPDWRAGVFKNRGLLLLPVALALIAFGRPSLLSAELGIGIALAGELLRIWAVGYSGVTTRDKTVTAPQLVTAGPYALVRNPLYLGNAIIALGFAIAYTGGIPSFQSFWLIVLILAWVIAVYAMIIPLEEAFLAHTYGTKYTEYTTLVPRIIPWRGALAKAKQQGTWNGQVIWSAEIVTLMFFVLMAVVCVLKLSVLAKYTQVF